MFRHITTRPVAAHRVTGGEATQLPSQLSNGWGGSSHGGVRHSQTAEEEYDWAGEYKSSISICLSHELSPFDSPELNIPFVWSRPTEPSHLHLHQPANAKPCSCRRNAPPPVAAMLPPPRPSAASAPRAPSPPLPRSSPLSPSPQTSLMCPTETSSCCSKTFSKRTTLPRRKRWRTYKTPSVVRPTWRSPCWPPGWVSFLAVFCI